jgi:predicted metal-binding membrane protein
MMGGLPTFVGVWVTMMAAMMLPAAAPMVAAYAGIGRLAAAGLTGAGIYQLTPLKNACLRRYRAPLGFVTRRWRSGPVGAFSMGAEHGTWCAGCCAGLMVALFALGIMNLAWMAAVALLILVEKALPGGERLARTAGAGLIAAGVVVLA